MFIWRNARVIFSLIISLLMFNFYGCQKKTDDSEVFAKIGSKSISMESLSLFKRMRQLYPQNYGPTMYPDKRSMESVCIETEIFYNKANKSIGSEIKNTLDWKWKKRFYPAQNYLIDVMHKQWGFSEVELKEYYDKNIEKFKMAKPIKFNDSLNDSSAQAATVDTTVVEDSYAPFESVKSKIAEDLFFSANPPDDTFLTTLDSTQKTDLQTIRKIYMGNMRQGKMPIFLSRAYQRIYGKPYPESVKDLFGEGKLISQEDFDVILNWIPEVQRKEFADKKHDVLVEWLVKWLIFSQEAENKKYTESNDIKTILEWAWKFEVVQNYLNNHAAKDMVNNIVVDTAMSRFEYWDRSGIPGESIDSVTIASMVKNHFRSKLQVAFDKMIYKERKKHRVVFFQDEAKDELVLDVKKLSADADSLYAAGNSKKAEVNYRILLNNFPFTIEGQDAFIELAKILTEKGKFSTAIKNYRLYLLYSDNKLKYSNVFFMIGFVYGEHMQKPLLAEASYKWIIKNTPESDLADDAEFMLLHLDEPMIGVEALQAEARRQGRNIDGVK